MIFDNCECLSWLKTLDDDSVDLVLTDPPYSSGGQFRSDRNQDTRTKYAMTWTQKEYACFSGDNRDQRSYAYWCALWMSECLRIAKPGAFIVCFTDWRQLPITSDAMQAGGWLWRGVLVWDKTEAARPQKGRYRNQCEYGLWGTNGPAVEKVEDCLPGVFRCNVTGAKKYHQTGKPEKIISEIMRIVPRGSVVLDPFAGGGTTAVVAKNMGMDCLTCEINREVYETAIARIHEADGGLFGGVNV